MSDVQEPSSAEHFHFFKPEPVTWKLSVGPDKSMQFNLTNRPPNMLHRYMLKLVFGFHITVLDEATTQEDE